MNERGRQQTWYLFDSKSEEKKEELVCRHNVKPIGVYIRRHVALLAWYGAFMKILAKKRVYHRWLNAIKRGQIYIELCNSIAKRLSEEDL